MLVSRTSGWSHTVSGSLIAPGFQSRQCLTGMWRDGSAAMLAARMLAGVTLEMNLGKCVTHMAPTSLSKSAHSGFETKRRLHQKSKTGVSVAPQKELMYSNFFFKKELIFCQHIIEFSMQESFVRRKATIKNQIYN